MKSYVSVAETYEHDMLQGIRSATTENPYVPKYLKGDGSVDTRLLSAITEAAVITSENRTGDNYDMLTTTFADYLHDHYGVSMEDCEFLVCLSSRSQVHAAASAATRALTLFQPYVDWDRYNKDHPDPEKKG